MGNDKWDSEDRNVKVIVKKPDKLLKPIILDLGDGSKKWKLIVQL